MRTFAVLTTTVLYVVCIWWRGMLHLHQENVSMMFVKIPPGRHILYTTFCNIQCYHQKNIYDNHAISMTSKRRWPTDTVLCHDDVNDNNNNLHRPISQQSLTTNNSLLEKHSHVHKHAWTLFMCIVPPFHKYRTLPRGQFKQIASYVYWSENFIIIIQTSIKN